MKKISGILVCLLFVFSVYASSDDGIGEAKSASLRLLTQIKGFIVQIGKIKTKDELVKLQGEFKKAQTKFVTELYAIYKKYPTLKSNPSFSVVKNFFQEIDFTTKKYQELYGRALSSFKIVKKIDNNKLVVKPGLTKEQVKALVYAMFNKVCDDLDAARSAKQAADVLTDFMKAIKKMKQLYSHMNMKADSSDEFKKVSRRFLKSMMRVGMKYYSDEYFKKAMKRLSKFN